MLIKKNSNTDIDTTSIRPIKDEHGNVIDDAQLIRLAKNMIDDFDAKGQAVPFLTANMINFINASVEELDAGATIQQVKDRHIQQDIDFSMLRMNPNL